MNIRKIIIPGLVAGFISFLVGCALYMNPLTSGIYTEHGVWVGSKPMDSYGGLGNWLLLMLLGGLFSTVLLTVFYSYTEKGIGIRSTWKKGLFFGFLYWLVSTLPYSYYTWLMYTYPVVLNIIETFNGLIGSVVAGVVLAVLYERLK